MHKDESTGTASTGVLVTGVWPSPTRAWTPRLVSFGLLKWYVGVSTLVGCLWAWYRAYARYTLGVANHRPRVARRRCQSRRCGCAGGLAVRCGCVVVLRMLWCSRALSVAQAGLLPDPASTARVTARAVSLI